MGAVVRAAGPTDRGDVYLKASAASPLFADEGRVTRALAELFPGQVPAPLATDGERRLLVLAGFGDPIGWEATAEVREQVIGAFARMQVQAAAHVERLLAAGCLDRRLGWLAAQARAWLPALEATGRLPAVDRAGWLSPGETAALRAALPRLTRMCSELESYLIPPSLVHGDLHLGNVARGPRGYLFFDWTDACVAHPFLDPPTFFQEHDREVDAALRERLADAYLGALNQALSYRSMVAHLDPPIDEHLAQAPASWLRSVLACL